MLSSARRLQNGGSALLRLPWNAPPWRLPRARQSAFATCRRPWIKREGRRAGMKRRPHSTCKRMKGSFGRERENEAPTERERLNEVEKGNTFWKTSSAGKARLRRCRSRGDGRRETREKGTVPVCCFSRLHPRLGETEDSEGRSPLLSAALVLTARLRS